MNQVSSQPVLDYDELYTILIAWLNRNQAAGIVPSAAHSELVNHWFDQIQLSWIDWTTLGRCD